MTSYQGTAPTPTRLETLLEEHGLDPVRASGFLVLSWIASADGEVSQSELHLLQQFGRKLGPPVEELIRLGCHGKDDELAFACGIIREFLSPKMRRLFLLLSLDMVLADSVLRTPEAYILQFVADLLELGRGGLDAVFRESTGRPFPGLPDPSRRQSWETGGDQKRSRRTGARQEPSRRLQALATLGLQEGASQDEIKDAYRRLAQVHHPDRFAQLGPEASNVANHTFVRIKEAYEVLKA